MSCTTILCEPEVEFLVLVAGKAFMVQLLGPAHMGYMSVSSKWNCQGLGGNPLKIQKGFSNVEEHRQAEHAASQRTLQAWLACAMCHLVNVTCILSTYKPGHQMSCFCLRCSGKVAL